MDILHLVDRLEELFNESRSVWLTRRVLVNEDKMLDLIDQMRLSIPEEIKQAQQIISQKDRIIAQAQESATRSSELAREKNIQLVERDSIVQAAHVRADEIHAKAKEDADVIRKEADEYAMKTLINLEIKLERIMAEIKNGIKTLEHEQDQKVKKEKPS
jgi:hypothetical protein